MRLERSLGVQLHPTSLPGGRLGPEAYAFVDWLADAGARWWQVLPLNPPDEFGSPYASASAFASWGGLLADPEAPVAPSDARAFGEREQSWIDDWAAFAGDGAVDEQVRFEREWGALRSYAASRGVRIIGDVPIYVAVDGCDHAAHPELFLPLDEVVAGAPPDDLNDLGQLWGNPLYDWEAMARTGYRWWIDRMRRVLALVDVFRIDHFRGFAGYWTVPAGAETARDGWWSPGPGAALFRAAEAELGPLPVIAEDLGVITPDVHALRDELGFPGMAVLLWSFSGPAGQPAPPREPPREPGRLHVDPRHRHARRVHRGERRLAADRARAVVAMRPRDRARPGRARARQRGADEPPRRDRRQLAWRLEPGELTAAHASGCARPPGAASVTGAATRSAVPRGPLLQASSRVAGGASSEEGATAARGVMPETRRATRSGRVRP